MDGIDLFLGEVAAARPEARELQFAPGAARLDLTWGHPDPTLLPAAELGAAAEAVLTGAAGPAWRALSYGAAEGSGRLRVAVADLLGRPDAPVGPDEVVVTYGSTGALDLFLDVRAGPGDVVLVEQPTYFLALRIIADRGLTLVGLPPGADPAAALAEAALRLRAAGHRGRTFLYLCPTHANPTGRTLDLATREALVVAAATHAVTIIEDDVYSELGTEPVPPMWALAPDRVVRLGSFSKTIAPGLRLGYVRADRATAAALAGCGVLDSGGGANPLVASVVAELIGTGAYARVVDGLRTTYRERMTALLSAIGDEHLPAGRPTGGYFAWLRRRGDEADDGDLVARAAAQGVAVSPARVFHVDPVDGRSARVSCSLLGTDDLADASVRLARALGPTTSASGSGAPGGPAVGSAPMQHSPGSQVDA